MDGRGPTSRDRLKGPGPHAAKFLWAAFSRLISKVTGIRIFLYKELSIINEDERSEESKPDVVFSCPVEVQGQPGLLPMSCEEVHRQVRDVRPRQLCMLLRRSTKSRNGAAEERKVTEDLPSRIPIAWMDAFESLEMTCRKNAF